MPTNNFPGIGYRNHPANFNFYEKVSISATTFGADSVNGQQPDIAIPFVTNTVMFLNEGTGVVEYSLDGISLHGELDSSKASAGLIFDNRVMSLVWFRVKSGSSGPITIRVDAWGTR